MLRWSLITVVFLAQFPILRTAEASHVESGNALLTRLTNSGNSIALPQPDLRDTTESDPNPHALSMAFSHPSEGTRFSPQDELQTRSDIANHFLQTWLKQTVRTLVEMDRTTTLRKIDRMSEVAKHNKLTIAPATRYEDPFEFHFGVDLLENRADLEMKKGSLRLGARLDNLIFNHEPQHIIRWTGYFSAGESTGFVAAANYSHWDGRAGFALSHPITRRAVASWETIARRENAALTIEQTALWIRCHIPI